MFPILKPVCSKQKSVRAINGIEIIITHFFGNKGRTVLPFIIILSLETSASLFLFWPCPGAFVFDSP